MTATVTDLFCGAGGSSLGAEAAGMRLVIAANHWATAIEVHQAHFPEAGHDLADVSQADPRRYPRTDVLVASPECTNHSRARGVSRRRQDPSLWDAPDPTAERSRATMWDVVRFAEQMRYSAVVVENVVEATQWRLWPAWFTAMDALGYERRALSHNSMHHGVPQSRDRVYVVFWRKGLKPDLELERKAFCRRCDARRVTRQAWKNGRTIGRYRQQWYWACTTCGTRCEPATRPAAEVIDWSLPTPRIGERRRPLAPKTRDRILIGLRRYGWLRSPDPHLPPAVPAGLLVQPHHKGSDASRVRGLEEPTWAVTASDDRPALVVPLRRNGRARPTSGVLPTVAAGGGHHSLLVPDNGKGAARTVGEPSGTQPTRDRCALVDAEAVVDDCGFRMLQPHEVAAAMALPDGYLPARLTKRARASLAGNAVTPPVMAWLCGRLLHALAEAGR